MTALTYRGSKTSQISFPLGGIGTGCIGLAGNGRLVDWEIFNRPNKGSANGFSHFAIRAEEAGEVLDARVLHGDLSAPYQGEFTASKFGSFGWGPRREFLTGLPHFKEAEFHGEFPVARVDYKDESFPGQVSLQAFNPLIPTNAEDSGLPAAFFEFAVTNPSPASRVYCVVGALTNPLPERNVNTVEFGDGTTMLHCTNGSHVQDRPGCGELVLATDAGRHADCQVSWQQYWYRGAWFDNLEVYWNDLNAAGPFENRVYAGGQVPEEGARLWDQDTGLLAVRLPVASGETKRVRFVISWYFPRCENYWKPEAERGTWRNYYATGWEGAREVAQYALSEWNRLHEETVRFKEALFQSTLPVAALDAVSANLAVLKSPTVLRLEDGTFYGWEGLHPDEGCCEGSCTHVWGYQQALPFLFPELERSMRAADYRFNLLPSGAMPFRLQLPIGTDPSSFRPCCDGQFGGVMKTYRDWKISGDDEWLRTLWPAVKQSLEYAWSTENEDRWDPERSGVLTGRQHHTLDMELFGPNSWLTGFYLGALKAAAEMARHLGDEDDADTYLEIFERGKKWADERLFNGEYFVQVIDLGDEEILESFGGQDDTLRGGSALEAYWNREHEEIKYQIGEGSSIDQVLAQWHASLYGLGELFAPEKVRQACAAIYRHNFIPDMGQAYNPCRVYSLNDEGGLIICAWPEGARKPLIPAPYSQETMNGFEYAAAIHMIMVGLVDEGMRCVEAIRYRYDGERRNPWNEFECGSNYARSMASYALLNAFSGFQFDMTKGSIGFNPVCTETEEEFICFWSLDAGWGQFRRSATQCTLEVLFGQLPLQELRLPFLKNHVLREVALDGSPVAFERTEQGLSLGEGMDVRSGQTLTVDFA